MIFTEKTCVSDRNAILSPGTFVISLSTYHTERVSSIHVINSSHGWTKRLCVHK